MPSYPIEHPDNLEPYKTNRILRHVMDERDALQARLATATEALMALAESSGNFTREDYRLDAAYTDARAVLDALEPDDKGD